MEDNIIKEFGTRKLSNGLTIAESTIGSEVLKMASEYVQLMKLQTELPYNTFICRSEDMSTIGRLRILLEDDGDVCVAIIDRHGEMADVQYCTIGSGGGRSPRTFEALRQLAAAMILDNLEDPTRACER